MSWLYVANDSDFSLANLPYGVFSRTVPDACRLKPWGVEGKKKKKKKQKKQDRPAKVAFEASTTLRSIGVRIGDFVLDVGRLAALGCFADARVARALSRETLNDFMALSPAEWSATRASLTALLGAENESLRNNRRYRQHLVVPVSLIQPHLPAAIGDYTDFYASLDHAKNVGTMMRGPDNALMPNWRHIPVGYHGRASSVIVSGEPVTRPWGQLQPGTDAEPKPPVFAPSAQLDFELEVGMFVGGPANALGTPVPMSEAEDRMFGFVLLNDWSARDIQKWEYVPLGPFLAKNFGTSISPWVVPMEALRPFACKSFYPHEPAPLPHLHDDKDLNLDVQLQVAIKAGGASSYDVVCSSNMRYLYWTFKQQLVHHASNGCNLQPGDLLGSGTISGPKPEEFGSMLEITWRGTKPVKLGNGAERKFLADGDTVRMTGGAQHADGRRVGFGACEATILPARK